MLQDTSRSRRADAVELETRKYFDVEVEKVDQDELPNPVAKDGVRITLTDEARTAARPVRPVAGAADQHPDAEKLKIPIIGRVIGNISVHGRYWNEEQGVLRLGQVKSDEGVTTPTESRDPRRRGRPGEADRRVDAIRRSWSRRSANRSVLKDTLVHVPLIIEIPKGTPPMARLDTQQSDEARVVHQNDAGRTCRRW